MKTFTFEVIHKYQPKLTVNSIRAKLFTVLCSILLVSLTGCEAIDTESELTCKNIYSDIKNKSENVFLPELNKIKNIDEYIKFIHGNYNYIKHNDENFRSCIKDSKYFASERESIKWINAAVLLNSLAIFWSKIVGNPNNYDPSDIDYSMAKDIHALQKIINL